MNFLLKKTILAYCLTIALIGIKTNNSHGQEITPDIIVALDGTGDYTAIQAAIDAVPDNSDENTIILIKKGLYDQEKIYIPSTKKNLLLVGESREETIISYHLYECLSGGFEGRCPAEDAMLWSSINIQTAATLTVDATDFIAENLTIQNTAGPVGQAQAVTVLADRVIFRNCNLTGYQDTLYLKSDGKRTYFEKCMILGRTDYIYGGGTVYFQECEIRSWGGGWITAPATSFNQPYGYVFNECEITFTLNSPRSGDDAKKVSLGRPWKNYPKVAWLHCNMTEKIAPLGWTTKWNMDYADTSPDLHLYEYQNTGPGADVSERNKWVGLRVLTDDEAINYTLLDVLSGNDNWDPTATITAVRIYNWTATSNNADWLTAENWDLGITPKEGEKAFVTDNQIIEANGGHFSADLILNNEATLKIKETSSLTSLAIGNATLSGNDSASLTGSIRTKDSITITTEEQFELATVIKGSHRITKTGVGSITIPQSNTDFTGFWLIQNGELIAEGPNALGQSRRITIQENGKLTINDSTSIHTDTPLYIQQGAQLQLNSNIVLSEFYIDGIIQPVGEYTAESHPDYISGLAKMQIIRPANFTFTPITNAKWDNPENFQPSILPQENETVFTTKEIETSDYIFPADIVFQPGASLLLQGDHSATGTLSFQNASTISYVTNEDGYDLDAPIDIAGEVTINLNSGFDGVHSMNLLGTIVGNSKISAFCSREDTENIGVLTVSGSNEEFEGTWDMTIPNENPNSSIVLNSAGVFSLGRSTTVDVSDQNILQLSHPYAAGEILRVNLSDDAYIQLDTFVKVKALLINGIPLALGTHDNSTNPEIFKGAGNITIGQFSVNTTELDTENYVEVRHNRLILKDNTVNISMYNLSGQLMNIKQDRNSVDFSHLPLGIYVVRIVSNGNHGSIIIPRY